MADIYGIFEKPSCDVVDNKGNHCPEEATEDILVNGKKHKVCVRCAVTWCEKASDFRENNGKAR